MELQHQESVQHDADTSKPLLSADDLVAQQQFAESIPVIEREGNNILWVKAQQK